MKKQNNKGISLIVLVITIIVMIILAATVIISLSSNSVVDKANEAVDVTNLKSVQQAATLAWADAYAEGKRDVDDLKDAIEQALEDAGVDLDKYEITVTIAGVTVTATDTDTDTDTDTGVVPEQIDWETLVADLAENPEAYRHESQDSSIADVGIGTDGKPVNLSLWKYYKTDTGEGMSLGKIAGSFSYVAGYDALKLSAGKVRGKMPQYIYLATENKVYPVTELICTFAGIGGLKEVPEIPSTVTYIGAKAFYNCQSITSVTIPSRVTNIGESAFDYCISLASITMSENVTSIGWGAFRYCVSLTELTIPSGVTSISGSAFYGCTGLTELTIPSSVTSIYVNAFYNVPHVTYTGTATGSPWGAVSIN